MDRILGPEAVMRAERRLENLVENLTQTIRDTILPNCQENKQRLETYAEKVNTYLGIPRPIRYIISKPKKPELLPVSELVFGQGWHEQSRTEISCQFDRIENLKRMLLSLYAHELVEVFDGVADPPLQITRQESVESNRWPVLPGWCEPTLEILYKEDYAFYKGKVVPLSEKPFGYNIWGETH